MNKLTKSSLLILFYGLGLLNLSSCEPAKTQSTKTEAPFIWNAANIYFLLTDRFYNGNKENDNIIPRNENAAKLRGFMGGDIKGITEKIKEGYFQDLGINAIWFTPIVEQIHGSVDEGTGETYPFHGYWAKDWTKIDPNFGTKEDLAELVKVAHDNGIRIILDVVINHTGPVTDQDPVWDNNWVRTEPQCTYDSYENFVNCTLVENLPDVLTGSDENVEIPTPLVEKWTKEGRLEKEQKELDEFFARTGYPRAPRFYIIKWLTDYIREFGVDGFRVDTVKHTEESVWGDLHKEAIAAFKDWKKANPDKVLDDNDFYMVGEVYGYNIGNGRNFMNGDKEVDYFDEGFNTLISFGLKWEANEKSYEEVFASYDSILNNELKGKGVVNYVSSHDDGHPFDKMREKPFKAANFLFLAPGSAQVYYGDETNRSLDIEGTVGDATLRSFMNWDEIEKNSERNGFKTKDVLSHWQKLGKFKSLHPVVGIGRHQMITEAPYVFSRSIKSDKYSDQVVVGLDLPKGKKDISVAKVFEDGQKVKDFYSGTTATVKGGKVTIDTPNNIVLFEAI
ncbi:alpha-amylase [Sediminitomix flava]|uniref:Alpha-amylase n=2 Tax=Sediminitomix flava TaxID=379075 RepID=A0A315ZBG2_SEDFL|nr:alpha-amylase [Sediminitomix flava]